MLYEQAQQSRDQLTDSLLSLVPSMDRLPLRPDAGPLFSYAGITAQTPDCCNFTTSAQDQVMEYGSEALMLGLQGAANRFSFSLL